jgi:hypothetical protein
MATDVPKSELIDGEVTTQHHELAMEQKLTDINYIIDPIISKRVTRKFDLRILPLLFGIWYENHQ